MELKSVIHPFNSTTGSLYRMWADCSLFFRQPGVTELSTHWTALIHEPGIISGKKTGVLSAYFPDIRGYW